MLFSWLLALHVISMVAWFAGLFYLPRLFMYHTLSSDAVSLSRFKIMERKLYWIIMTPAGLLTTAFGIWLLHFNLSYYLHEPWMIAKLILVLLLWGYHLFCGHLLALFARDQNHFSSRFYRFFNEIPTLFLFAIIILVIVKP